MMNETPDCIQDGTPYKEHVLSFYTHDDNNIPHQTYTDNPVLSDITTPMTTEDDNNIFAKQNKKREAKTVTNEIRKTSRLQPIDIEILTILKKYLTRKSNIKGKSRRVSSKTEPDKTDYNYLFGTTEN